ncbi:hypothetical protein GW17_00025264 [Ensete ventricosum]|nr:hypothetical protein GW17_00025264 [Ensete ventricosum]
MAQTAPRFSTRPIPASTAGAGPTEATRSLPTYLTSQRWDMGPTKSAITEQVRKSELRLVYPLLYPKDTRLERTGGAHGGNASHFRPSLVQHTDLPSKELRDPQDATNTQ